MAFKIKDTLVVGTKTVLNTNGQAQSLEAVGTTGAFFAFDTTSTKDAIILLPIDNGTASRRLNITHAALGATRTATFPDATGNVVIDSATQTLTNKSLSDSTTFFIDETDATKKLQFQLSSIATATTRTLTVPNFDDTIAVTDSAQTLQNKTLRTVNIRDSDNTHNYIISPGNLTIDRTISIPVLTGNDTLVFESQAQSLSSKTLVLPKIQGTTPGNDYTFAVNNLAAGRTITLPLLTGNDVFVFEAHTQTLTNKTLTSPTINSGALSGTFSGDHTYSGIVTISNTTVSAGAGSGALVVSGGVGIGGALNVTGNTIITGNLTVNGTTTTINSTTLSVDDINVVLGDVASPTDTTANGGGITLKGTTDKTFQWQSASGAWESNVSLRVLTGGTLTADGAAVFNGNVTLGDANSDAITINAAIANNNSWKTTTTSGNTYHLAAYDNDNTTYRNLVTLTAGNVPQIDIGNSTDVNAGTITVNGYFTTLGLNGTLTLTSTTNATSKTTGALQVDGGVSVDKDIFLVGSTVYAGDVAPSNTTSGTAVADVKGFQQEITVNTQFVLDSWAIATYRSAKYMIQMTQGTQYQFSEVSVIHDGTTTYFTEYGVVENVSGGAIGAGVNFATDVNAGNARLLVTINDAATTPVRVNILRTLMRIYN